MKKIALLLCLILVSPLCQATTLDLDGVFDKLHAERMILKQDYEETSKLMKPLKKKKLASATDLMKAIADVLERTGSEGALLSVLDRVTDRQAKADAEKLVREHYASLADLTEMDVEFVKLVARDHKTKELTALASKVQGDIQKTADRYRALSKE